MSLADSSEFEDRPYEKKATIYIFSVFVLAVILAIRLFQIQVYNHDLYLNKSEDYRIKRVIIDAPRGFIYDRNGITLATNRRSYSVTIDPFDRDHFDTTIPKLASLVPDLSKIFGLYQKSLVDSLKTMALKINNPSVIIQDADFKTQSVIEEHILELPGIGSEIGQRRYYPNGKLACHIIGYMGKLRKEEAEQLVSKGYYKDQWIGRYGIESYYEKTLKGENGAKFLEKNYLNRLLGTIKDYKPKTAVSGTNVSLTIDLRLQKAAEEGFGDSIRGAFVALNPKNGEILIMASFPAFDPNEFASVMTDEKYASLINDPEKPFYNRAIQGLYPPGSTFKMVAALSGLEKGLPYGTRFQSCHGFFRFGRDYHCWNKKGHGSLNMIEAITQSCNVYFFQLGLRVGLDKWSETCRKLGFGAKTSIDLYGEEMGNLPSESFYEKNKQTYSTGMILNLAIGQGENSVTPLQLAHYIGIIASEGMDANPHLVMTDKPLPAKKVDISAESFKVVKEGMFGVINSPQGTAKNAKVPGHLVAGKTGTSQNPQGADHKVFVGFAPYDDPEIAFACIAENSGNITPSVAVSITRKVLEAYFKYYPDKTVPSVPTEKTVKTDMEENPND